MGSIIEILFIIILVLLLIINLLVLLFRKSLKAEDNHISGFEIARKICDFYNKDTHIIKKKGLFLDYYDQTRDTIKLTPEVFDGTDLFACAVAILNARCVSDTEKNFNKNHNLLSFIILSSYVVIILGSFLNEAKFIHFGMIIFIITIILEWIHTSYQVKQIEKEDPIYKLLKKEKLISDIEEHYEVINAYSLVYVANLPYRFITFFR